MNLRVACLEMFKGVAGFGEWQGGGVECWKMLSKGQ